MADVVSEPQPSTARQGEAMPYSNQAAAAIVAGIAGSLIAGPIGAIIGAALGAIGAATLPFMSRNTTRADNDDIAQNP